MRRYIERAEELQRSLPKPPPAAPAAPATPAAPPPSSSSAAAGASAAGAAGGGTCLRAMSWNVRRLTYAGDGAGGDGAALAAARMGHLAATVARVRPSVLFIQARVTAPPRSHADASTPP